MRWGLRRPQRFYARPALEVACELVGSILVHRLQDGSVLAGRIVEVEAYLGDGTDASSHSHRGPTARNRSMFGPPGRLYAYRSYGIHTCVNVVCDKTGVGSAILLRAAEPVLGIEVMRANRGLSLDANPRLIASGPGRLAQAFAIELEHDGASMTHTNLCIHKPSPNASRIDVETGTRIGISKAAELPYRFFARDDPWVSPHRKRKKTRPAKTTAR